MRFDVAGLPRRWPLELVGVLLLSLLLWFVAPYVSIASWTPLESALARSVLILLAIAGWALSVFLRRRKSQRASDKIEEGIVSDRGSGERQDERLRRQFEEAIEFLRRSAKGKNLYELPWYVIVGPPGSGKTTALKNSGLNFPLDRKFGKNALRGVGGTRNCDWWFTDEAVLLDTAGRYFTQDSDEAGDSAEWRRFLDLLATYRKRRPINGVLVAFSARDLMEMSPSEHERHVATIRGRIDEIQKQLNVHVPIYFLVTKCDLVAGFVEFFEEFDHEQRNQVWGMTRPAPTDAESDVAGWFQQEYDSLISRLDEHVLERLAYERATQRRALLFGFPRRMESLREALSSLIEEAFAPNRFDSSMMLRGVYFTSGTQEGTPIDRLMENLAAAYGVSAAVLSDRSDRVQSRSFFINRTLLDLVFVEQGLAGVNWRFEVGRAVAQNAAYVGGLALVGILIATWVAGYRANGSYISGIDELMTQNAAVLAKPPPCEEDPAQLVSYLDTLGTISKEANRYEVDRPIWMGLGMYQGESVGAAARGNYHQAIGKLLVPKLATVFEHGIGSTSVSTDHSRLFAYVEGYLMLASVDRRDRAELGLIAGHVLRDRHADHPELAAGLAGHLDAALQDGAEWSNLPLDDKLVEGARVSLQQPGDSALMLSRATIAYGTGHPNAIPLDRKLGLKAATVIRRKSGKPLSEAIPALFTKATFDELQGEAGGKLLLGFLKDRWVVDPQASALDVAAQTRIAREFVDDYEKTYIKYWDGLVADMEIVPLPADPSAAKPILAQLTGSMSPLRAWFQLVNAQTNLAGEPASGDAAKIPEALTGTLSGMLGALSGRGGARAGARITEHFAEFRDVGKTLDGIEPILEEIYVEMDAPAAAGGSVGGRTAMATALNKLKINAGRLPAGTGKLFDPVVGTTTTITKGQAAEDATKTVREGYANEVLPDCKALIEGRFPFASSTGSEVAAGDFGRFFGPGGVIDGFFMRTLAEHVDTSGWTWKKDSPAAGLGTGFLQQFRLAKLIRDMFFGPGGTDPRLSLTVQVDHLDSSVREFRWSFGGKTLLYRHGAPSPERFEWPGAADRGLEYEFDLFQGGRPGRQERGSWGLLRVLDDAKPVPVSGSEREFRATLTGGDATAELIVGFDSPRNPLKQTEWRRFRCGKP